MALKFKSMHDVGKRIIVAVVGIEGDYSEHPDDPGRATKFGITEARARGAGYVGNMCDMSKEWALDFYAEHEWFANNYHHLEHYVDLVDNVFDFGVNAGHGKAVRVLQEALNLCNRKGFDWADLKVDGQLGLLSSRAVNDCVSKRGLKHLIKVFNVGVGKHYWDITKANMNLESFFNGWVDNRIE